MIVFPSVFLLNLGRAEEQSRATTFKPEDLEKMPFIQSLPEEAKVLLMNKSAHGEEAKQKELLSGNTINFPLSDQTVPLNPDPSKLPSVSSINIDSVPGVFKNLNLQNSPSKEPTKSQKDSQN